MIIQKCRQVNRFFPPPKKFTFFSPVFTRRHTFSLPRPRRTGGRTFCPHSLAIHRGFAGAAPHGRPNFSPAFTRRRAGISMPAAVDGGGGVCYNIYIIYNEKVKKPRALSTGVRPDPASGLRRGKETGCSCANNSFNSEINTACRSRNLPTAWAYRARAFRAGSRARASPPPNRRRPSAPPSA